MNLTIFIDIVFQAIRNALHAKRLAPNDFTFHILVVFFDVLLSTIDTCFFHSWKIDEYDYKE